MLTDDNILTIYNSPDLIKVCKKLYGQDWEELRSIVIERIIHKTELENTNMIAYSIQCAYNTFKNNIKKHSLTYDESGLLLIGIENPKSEIEDKKLFEIKLDKLIEKVNQDKNNAKRMYGANIYDIVIKHKGNILNAQKQIKLPYFEVRKAVREYEEYLKDYFKNKI